MKYVKMHLFTCEAIARAIREEKVRGFSQHFSVQIPILCPLDFAGQKFAKNFIVTKNKMSKKRGTETLAQ